MPSVTWNWETAAGDRSFFYGIRRLDRAPIVGWWALRLVHEDVTRC